MPKIKLIVEYDGSRFYGWQKQPGLRTVQSELERVLGVVCRQEVGPLHAAGRTDSGVHARGQVVTFKLPDLAEPPDLWRVSQGVSHLMKGELSVLSAEVVADNFHPGIDATHKQYSYRILNRPTPAVLDVGRVWHISRPVDLQRMRVCAASLVGEHDFSTFRDSECCAKSTVKTIYESVIEQHGDLLVYRVIGSGFLKQMVRNIVGSLVDVGLGRLRVNSFNELLEKRDRRAAGVTAPAYALTMDWVSYCSPPELPQGSKAN